MINIDQQQFEDLSKDKDAVIIDVRTPMEWEDGVIPTTHHFVNFHESDTFLQFLKKLPQDKKYLMVCRSGNRSGIACQMMDQMGFEHTYNLFGGVLGYSGNLKPYAEPKEAMKLKYDLICCGGGIMSLTLALMTKLLDPSKEVLILERLGEVAQESTAAWNNAGTGHSSFCELNYTSEREDGSIDMTKAVKVCKQFEMNKQFWSYLIERGLIKDPQVFANPMPHHAWVRGQKNVDFLKKRYEAMSEHFMFKGMEYTEDASKMEEWFPLIMEDREEEVSAATRMDIGFEMNFEALTKEYKRILIEEFDQTIHFRHEVVDIDPDPEIDWTVEIKNLDSGESLQCDAEHVFIGAGGGALPLLQKVEIDEKDGYGGFPVGGQWLICKNQEVIDKHWAKVYSKADVGTPPMSVPHLDTRIINGKRELLFGPFAGFSTKFLKEGSFMDLPLSINFDNIPSMWGAFWHNLDLTRYLIEQVLMTHEQRMDDLRKFVVEAKSDEWKLLEAGQRVQIIKKDEEKGGKLQFGTEVVASQDGTITALLGASPGASTAVYVMLETLHKAFPEVLESEAGHRTMSEMIPLWNKDPESHQALFLEQRVRTNQIMGIKTEA